MNKILKFVLSSFLAFGQLFLGAAAFISIVGIFVLVFLVLPSFCIDKIAAGQLIYIIGMVLWAFIIGASIKAIQCFDRNN